MLADLFSQHAKHRVCSTASRGHSTSRALHCRPVHTVTGPETAPLGLRQGGEGGLLLGLPAKGCSLYEAGVDVVHGPVDCRGDAKGVQAVVALGAAHGGPHLVLVLLLHQV